jgi:hypothetical protein
MQDCGGVDPDNCVAQVMTSGNVWDFDALGISKMDMAKTSVIINGGAGIDVVNRLGMRRRDVIFGTAIADDCTVCLPKEGDERVGFAPLHDGAPGSMWAFLSDCVLATRIPKKEAVDLSTISSMARSGKKRANEAEFTAGDAASWATRDFVSAATTTRGPALYSVPVVGAEASNEVAIGFRTASTGAFQTWRSGALGGLLGVLGKSAVCTGNDEPGTVTDHCEATGSAISIAFMTFLDIFYAGDGAAVRVEDKALVSLRSVAFYNCTTQAEGYYMGGCACLMQVESGTEIIDTCAGNCGSGAGSFVWMTGSDADVALKGLALVECSSTFGTIHYQDIETVVSTSNFTCLGAELVDLRSSRGVIFQTWFESPCTTNGSFLLFANCSDGDGLFLKWSGDVAVFVQCSFVSNAIGAIAHFGGGDGRDLMKFCYFANTNLSGYAFREGSVLLDCCLFWGEVQSTGGFVPTGVQAGFTSTEISFETASLLPTCRGVARPVPARTPRESSPRETTTVPASQPPKFPLLIVGLMVGGAVLIAAAVLVFCVLQRRRRSRRRGVVLAGSDQGALVPALMEKSF